VIDMEALMPAFPSVREWRIVMNRIDTRTYREAPILVEGRSYSGRLIATTLRPFGGLGIQPIGVPNNPAGAWLLSSILEWVAQ
jgi:hypothetical protein